MADTDNPAPAGPVTNVTVNPAPPVAQPQPVQQVQPPPPEPVDPANQVTVKAVRSFHGVEGFKNPRSEPFTVSRQRAADLFANGLIEYVNEADEDAAIDAAADAQVAKIKAAADSRRSKKTGA